MSGVYQMKIRIQYFNQIIYKYGYSYIDIKQVSKKENILEILLHYACQIIQIKLSATT